MDFLPQGYSVPKTSGKYLKFDEGDNKFRILSSAITGWLDWTAEKKPVRTKEKPEKSIDPSKPARHFWAFIVFDYKSNEVKFLEITQSGIQNAIYDLHADANWGSPLGYDLNVKRKGKEMNTEYTVIPTPPMPVKPEIKQLYESLTIDLNALYRGDDPFNVQSTVSTTKQALNGQIEANNEEVDMSEVALDEIPF